MQPQQESAAASNPLNLKYSQFTKNRIEAFCDGVFAIIVTLLILELKAPHLHNPDSGQELLSSLAALSPKFIGWVISFFTVCIVWMNHHRLFDMFKGVSVGLFWLNVHLMLWVCFIPFPTALVGDYPRNPLAVAFYGIVMFLAGSAFVAMRVYGWRHKELLKETVSLAAYKQNMLFGFIFGPVLYLVAAALALINPVASFAVYLLITAYFMFSFAIHK